MKGRVSPINLLHDCSIKNIKLKVAEFEIEISEYHEKLLGVKLDWNLTFEDIFLTYVKKLVEK